MHVFRISYEDDKGRKRTDKRGGRGSLLFLDGGRRRPGSDEEITFYVVFTSGDRLKLRVPTVLCSRYIGAGGGIGHKTRKKKLYPL